MKPEISRKTFLKKLGLLSAVSIVKKDSLYSHSIIMERKKGEKGFSPIITITPWGQKVQHDLSTYIKMEKFRRLKKEDSWEKSGKIIEKEIYTKVKRKKLIIEKDPIRLLDGLWVLGTDGQQRVYLIDTGNGLVIVDSSYEAFQKKIINQINFLGYSVGDVKWVLLTHCHVDHAQSANFWQKRGAKILIHKYGENPLRTGNEITAWWFSGKTKRYFTPVEDNIETFDDGDEIKLGSLKFYVIHTPGHTPGSSCFYFEKEGKQILISGDVVLHNGRHAWMGNHFANWDEYINSLWKVKRFSIKGYAPVDKYRKPIAFDFLLPGHGTISLENATRDIDKTIEIVSYIINERKKGRDLIWVEPYKFFFLRKIGKVKRIKIVYK